MDYTKEEAEFVFSYGSLNTKRATMKPAEEVFKELPLMVRKQERFVSFIAEHQNKEVLAALWLGIWVVFGNEHIAFTENCFTNINP